MTLLARRLADALESAAIPYAVGGALAYNLWSNPRGTIDLDLTAFLADSEWTRALEVLAAAGVVGDGPAALAALRDRGSCRLWHGDIRVDLFIPSIPFYASVERRVISAPLDGRPARFLTAEDLTVFKLLFFRKKDMVDIEYMLIVQGRAFDRAYVRRWLVDMVGDTDERVKRWDQLCSDVPLSG